MVKALAFILAFSLLFAMIYAGGGAGIYGSPFVAVADERQRALMLMTILAGPVACVAALVVLQGNTRSIIRSLAASGTLVAGAATGAYLGGLTRFYEFWEWPFLICVWLPMVLAALALWAPNPSRACKGGAAVLVATVAGYFGLLKFPLGSRSSLGLWVAIVSAIVALGSAFWAALDRGPFAGGHCIPPKDESEGKATTSLGLGLFSLVAMLIPWIGVPTAIAGFVMGIKGLGPQRRWTAIAGIVLSAGTLAIIALVLAVRPYLEYTGEMHLFNARHGP